MSKLSRWYRTSPVFRTLNARRVQVYCVGSAKSGTHSIAAMFSDTARAEHEPDVQRLIDAIFLRTHNGMTPEQWRQFVLKRDRELWLEIDSSHLNFYLLDVLPQAYPNARFVLTIRDCYSWLDSMINQQLTARNLAPCWSRWREVSFRTRDFMHPGEEQALQERGLCTLDGYLSYWATLNGIALSKIPQDRLLVVRTHEISQQADRIAQFAGVPLHPTAETHSYKARGKFNVLSLLDPGYLQAKVQQYCGPLMERFFPGFRTMSIALYASVALNDVALPLGPA